MEASKGFFVECVTVVGTDLVPAVIGFIDGLNVIEGASDTGKSYLLSLIDFGLGASTPPRDIVAAQGYERVVLRIRARETNTAFEIERSLAGGDVVIRQLGERDAVVEQHESKTRHDSKDEKSLSMFLLSLCGFTSVPLRKNQSGARQNLSFRNIAFLTIVDEARIIAETPPHLSGDRLFKTLEGDVFRLVVTGTPPLQPLKVTKGPGVQQAKAELSAVASLVGRVEAELTRLAVDPSGAAEELTQLQATWEAALQSFDASRVELAALESQRAGHTKVLRETSSRLDVIEGLLARFKLLDRHYSSDLDRLDTIYEVGSMLEEMPPKDCPVCGAPGSAYGTGEIASHFDVPAVRLAATAERQKLAPLRDDLNKTLAGLAAESAALEETRTRTRAELATLQPKLVSEMQTRSRITSQELQAHAARSAVLLQGQFLISQLTELRVREQALSSVADLSGGVAKSAAITPTTSELDAFAERVEEVLKQWSFPDLGRVVFSETTQDIVIAGENRKSRGKGVRALTYSAVIIALMRHCAARALPHPGFVVLDSPLVAYRPPDAGKTADPDVEKLQKAGVKEAFYSSLASDFAHGQVIVFENSAPTDVGQGKILHVHFSKNPTEGRYGFFPHRG